MVFSESWRKRHACERCRRHKVRCEYEDPTSQRCIRCARTNSECVVLERNNKKSNDPAPQKSAPPAQTSRSQPEAESKSKEVESSPLLRAAHDGLYEFEEMGVYYDLFIKSGVSLPICNPPKTLCELDKAYPLTAVALITCVAMAMSSKKVPERLKVVETQMLTGLSERQVVSVDSHSAFIILCQFLLPYGGKGLMRLSLLHGSMIALQAQSGFGFASHKFYGQVRENSQNETLIRLYEHTGNLLMSYSLDQQFERICPIASLYTPMESIALSCDREPMSMFAVFNDYRSTLTMMEQTDSVPDLMNICAMGIEKLANTPIQCKKHLTFAMVARMKLAVAALSWSVRSLGVERMDQYEVFFATIISQAIEFYTSHLMLEYQFSPSPILMCYIASTLINLLWSMRLYSFAVNLNIDVPVNDFCDMVASRWQVMANATYTGRASYVALITSLDLVRFNIGYYNDLTNHVEGSGSMETFYVYLMGSPNSGPLYEAAMSSGDLRELMRFDNMADRKSIGCRAIVPTSYQEFEEIFTHVVQGGILGLH